MKQTGCYLTEEARMKWWTKERAPLCFFARTRAPDSQQHGCCWCKACAMVRGIGYKGTGGQGGRVVLPWTPPSQTTDPWLPKGQFLQSEGAFQGGFDELHARKPRVDLKRCKRARSKTARASCSGLAPWLRRLGRPSRPASSPQPLSGLGMGQIRMERRISLDSPRLHNGPV